MEQQKASAIKRPEGMTVKAIKTENGSTRFVITTASGKETFWTWKLKA